MDGATLQQRIYYGYSKAAGVIGLPFSQYRPASAVNALAGGGLRGNITASFNAQDFTYRKPNGVSKYAWYCMADGRMLSVGDYLVSGPTTYFIAAMQPLLPILAFACNRVVTVYRPQQQAGVGAAGYGGNTAANETAIVTLFPASLLLSSKADKNVVNLPGDTRSAWDTLLLPPIPGGVILDDHDVVKDDLGNRYVIAGAELTALGWHCSIVESET